MISETSKQPVKHQCVSDDEEKQFVVQKKQELCTNSFKIQEHGIKCVKRKCLFSFLGQQE